MMHQKYITFIDIYEHNLRASKYTKTIINKIKERIWSYTIIARDFNSWLISMDRSSRQKDNKEAFSLKDTLDQMNLIDI